MRVKLSGKLLLLPPSINGPAYRFPYIYRKDLVTRRILYWIRAWNGTCQFFCKRIAASRDFLSPTKVQ